MSDVLTWRLAFKSMLSSMQAQDADGKTERDHRINEAIVKFLSSRSGLWLGFSGGDLEPLMNLTSLIQFKASSVQLAYPILDVPSSSYIYYFSDAAEPKIKKDLYFTFEPDLSDSSWRPVDLMAIGDLAVQGALIPGLGFDRAFYRLGRGSRFYERALRGLTIEKVGVCYAEQLVDAVPGDDEDLQMDVIITDKEIYQK